MRVIPRGGDKRDIIRRAPLSAPPSWIGRQRIDLTDVWGRMEWEKPSNTLRTAFVNPSKGRYIHPDQHRVIFRFAESGLYPEHSRRLHLREPRAICRREANREQRLPPLLGRAIARAVRRVL